MVSDIEVAKQRLHARLEELSQYAAQLHRWADIYNERAQVESEEDERELAEFARSADAPPQLRKLQEQIDRGELSWYGALLGEADGVMDPSALGFLQDRLAGLPAMGEALQSGASVEEAAESAGMR
ncbi:MAG TPA: hypothetical protein VF062_07740 [Candidatus Limnocylindrales bacterium]